MQQTLVTLNIAPAQLTLGAPEWQLILSGTFAVEKYQQGEYLPRPDLGVKLTIKVGDLNEIQTGATHQVWKQEITSAAILTGEQPVVVTAKSGDGTAIAHQKIVFPTPPPNPSP